MTGALAPEVCFPNQTKPLHLSKPVPESTSALRSERSFLFTAAGQFRPHTGFPFHPKLISREPRSKVTIAWGHNRVNAYILWPLCKSQLVPKRATPNPKRPRHLPIFVSKKHKKHTCNLCASVVIISPPYSYTNWFAILHCSGIGG